MPYDSSEKRLYKCNLKRMWEQYYEVMSFSQFKYLFHTKDPSQNLFFLDDIETVLMIHIKIRGVRRKLARFVRA